MKRTRMITDICFILLFAAAIITCFVLALTGTGKDRVSESENRLLANFPDAEFFSEEYKTQLADWLSDNLGMRDELLEMRGSVMLNLLNMVPSQDVERGRDGWYFYKRDHNMDIATGTFPVDEKKLKSIARTQQAISDYFREQGKTYILVITPSKVSVYPEYIIGDFTVGETVIDTVTRYLEENTDVIVVNTKNELLENKDKGQLFWKTDTHSTVLGSYYSYVAIFKKLRELGIVADREPVSVTPSMRDNTDDFHEFNKIFGNGDLLGTEISDSVEFEPFSEQVTTGSFCKGLNEICYDYGVSKQYKVADFVNPDESLPSLLIFGDSQFGPKLKIPPLLSRDFSHVIQTRLRMVCSKADKYVDPDIVIYTCAERFADVYLDFIPEDIFVFVDLPEIETKKLKNDDFRYHGMWLDKVNGVKTTEQGIITVDPDSEKTVLIGWAVDPDREDKLNYLYVRIGDDHIRCRYGTERQNILKKYGIENYLRSGFTVEIPTSLLYDENGALRDKIYFIAEAADGSCLYEPVGYSLKEAAKKKK